MREASARTSWRSYWVVFAGVTLGSCSDPTADDQEAIVELESIGVQATFGLDEAAGADAVFHKPLDAALTGGVVAILDASPPWVRLFDRTGTFLHAAVKEGEGPGEAVRPLTISTGPNGFLVNHANGIIELAEDGTLLSSAPIAFRAWGATSGCGNQLLGLSMDWVPRTNGATPSDVDIATALVRLDESARVLDTLATFNPVRPGSRNYHPWLVERTTGGLVLFTEEAGAGRLLEVSCEGDTRRELPIDSIGPGEVYDFRPEGQLLITSPQPPFPAGLEVVNDRVLWAVRAVESSAPGRVDSVTVITSFEGDAVRHRVRIRGWYQLLDSNAEGSLLLSNTWTLGQHWQHGGTWGPVPALFLVDGLNLMQQ